MILRIVSVRPAHARSPWIARSPFAVVLALVTSLTILSLLPIPSVRVIAGTVLVLFVPGAVFLRLILRERPRFVGVVAVLLSVVVSMACVILAVVCVAALRVPISRSSVLVATDVVTLTLALIGSRRAPLVSQDDVRVPRWHLPSSIVPAMVVAAVAVLATVAIASMMPQAPSQPFSSLFFTGSSAQIARPIPVEPHEHLSLGVGITNETPARRTFAVTTSLAGAEIGTEAVAVAPGQTVHVTVGGSVPATGCVERLTVVAGPGSSTSSLAAWAKWDRGSTCRDS